MRRKTAANNCFPMEFGSEYGKTFGRPTGLSIGWMVGVRLNAKSCVVTLKAFFPTALKT